MMTGVTFDWDGFAGALLDGLLQAAHTWSAENPDEDLAFVVMDHIYRERDGRIALPLLALTGDEAFRQVDDPWDVAAWDDFDVQWLGDDVTRDWERTLMVEACRDTTEHWEATFQTYLDMLIGVCVRARQNLSDDGHIIVVLFDEQEPLGESLLRRVLSASELTRYFPLYDERAIERARVSALPVADRVAYYASKLDSFEGAITGEEAERALRDIGLPSVAALAPMLRVEGQAWHAAKILAAIGEADGRAVHSLIDALASRSGPDQAWVAAALARLGRLDAMLDHIDVLPVDVVVRAVADAYSSWRDDTSVPRPLDYRPLAEFIERWPAFGPALDKELRPGQPACTIRVEEVDEAVRGLASPHVIVRRHAVDVLGEHRLGPAVAARVLPLLHELAEQDPDPDVRRLSLLSAQWLRGRNRSDQPR